MKVLWLTYDLPYPLVSGGKLRAYHLIKGLSESHQIDLFSFIRSDDQLRYLPQLREYCRRIETFKRPKVWSLRNVLRTGFSYLPFAAAAYYFGEVPEIIGKMLREENYDLVHLESFYPAVYLRFIKSRGFKTLMGNENIEYMVYRRFVDQKRFLPFKWLLSVDVFKMQKLEEKIWKMADANIATSKDDAEVISGIVGKECFVVPNGVDSERFSKMAIKKLPHNDPVCLFVGDFTYMTNRDAVKWLVKILNSQFSIFNFKLLIVGRNATSYIKSLASQTIIVDDSVKDIREAYAQADVFLAPIRIGGGTRLKILEAMAAGLPVVSTTVGAEGLEVKDSQNILLADAPQEFAQKVDSLLKNPSLRDNISAAGQELVRRKYDWKFSVQKLQRVYASLLQGI